MTKTATFASLVLVTAFSLTGCDAPNKADETKPAAAPVAKAKTADKADDAAKPADAEAATPADPILAMVAKRVSADSGLGVGGKFSAFDIINAASGEQYCQVCKFGPSPKIMAVGTADDEAFKKDIKDLDAIVAKYGDDKIKAFAVITELENGKAKTSTPVADTQALAKALQAELGVKIPIVVAAPEEGGPNRIWDEYYNVTASRTIMFADGTNTVRWNGVAAPDFKDLNTEIAKVLEG